MPYQVYRIDTYSASKNSHHVDRSESWVARKDKAFSTEEDAKQYIRERSLIHTELVNFLTKGMKMVEGDEREKIIDAFCFSDDKFMKYRRFFLGLVPVKAVIEALKKDGVEVIKVK